MDLKLNLQHFAEENTESTENQQEEEQDTTVFTQSEVDSQISKAVHSALEKREAKHKQELQEKINEALAEKERLSKLSEKERKEEEMTQREKEIAEREAKLQRQELKSDAIAVLHENNLPKEFADFLLADDAENTLENINAFKKAFDEAVNVQVKEKLVQDTPPASGSTITQKQQSIAEIAKGSRLV